MELQETHFRNYMGGIHAYSLLCGTHDNATNVQDVNTVGVALKVEDEGKLRYLTFTRATSTSSGKPTYATWSRFFMRGMAVRVGVPLRRY